MHSHLFASDTETAVHKATTSTTFGPPKQKHVRTCILETHKLDGGELFFQELLKRPLDKDDNVCWKSLILMHKVFIEGHPNVLGDAWFRISIFESIKESWQKYSSSPHELHELIIAYLKFLLEKITFHHNNRSVPVDISLVQFQKKL